MLFFTTTDPIAPTLKNRSGDALWNTKERVDFAIKTIEVVAKIHEEKHKGSGRVMEHRNLSADTILVREHEDGKRPILIGLHRARIPGEETILNLPDDNTKLDKIKLCDTLAELFAEQRSSPAEKSLAEDVEMILQNGKSKDLNLKELAEELRGRLASAAKCWKRWSVGQTIHFGNRPYRVESNLRWDVVGATFRVVTTQGGPGTYVAKVVRVRDAGERTLRAHRLACSISGNKGLAKIAGVAPEWSDGGPVALIEWHEGSPLRKWLGKLDELIKNEHYGDSSAEKLALRWLRTMCESLGVLHDAGLVHGNINPSSMIVSGKDLVLTGYDSVSRAGESVPGNFSYGSPSLDAGEPAAPSDDFYALAASMFHILYGQEPFILRKDRKDSVMDKKKKGLDWNSLSCDKDGLLCQFLDQATGPDKRFVTAMEALESLGHHLVHSARKS